MSIKLSSVLHQLSPSGRARRHYRGYLRNRRLDESTILLESQQGRSFNGNMFYLAKALSSCEEFSKFRMVIPASKDAIESFKELIAAHRLARCEVIPIHSARYIKTLASAKYLFTDTAFPPYFVKKEGQVVLNTWHGTPLKAMGRKDRSGLHSLGNIQRNFSFSDYLLYPSFYMAQHMFDDYMLNGICNAKVLFCGYPRNEPLLSEESTSCLPDYLFDGEHYPNRIYAYMPTWRPLASDVPDSCAGIEITSILLQMDARLKDDELLLVSLHPLQRAHVDFSIFTHIRCFPDNLEAYETLSHCDALITDYSSVLFDFAATRKDIILFAYDDDVYLRDRGMYLAFDQLPFAHVQTMTDLFAKLRQEGCSRAPKSFIDEYCSFERVDAAQRICEFVLFGQQVLAHDLMPKDERKNILIYGGNLAQNGISASLINFVNSIDRTKFHPFVTFETRQVKANKGMIEKLPNDVSYIPCMGKSNMTLPEKTIQYLYLKKVIPFFVFNAFMREAFLENNQRQYGGLPFHAAIQFSGYDFKKIYQFSLFDCKRVIFVHNDMVREALEKHNQRLDMLKYAYETYDKVAVVSKDILPVTKSIAPNAKGYCVAYNLFDYQSVVQKSLHQVEFDADTRANVTLPELMDFLDRQGKLIVSIGRYSQEKQHRLLIDAFNHEWSNDKALRLIIIGGNTFSDLYEDTVQHVASLPCSKSIVCIRKMGNPYPLLRRADGFILPSKYEGFGLVLLEAAALGIPVAATDIPGPRGIVKEYGGLLFENSFDGVSYGIQMLKKGQVNPMDIDFRQYNSEALKGYSELLN